MSKKLLILSDIHYPIGSLSTIKYIVEKEKPDNLALLGDNVELSIFRDYKKAYEEFFQRLNEIFPIQKSVIMLGDNDYQYSHNKDTIIKIIQAYGPINGSGKQMIFFTKGKMCFFHGNLEKNKILERLGYYLVMASNRIDYTIAPSILARISRLFFNIDKDLYLFLGHLHYLGKINNNIFCGTLNYKFMPFPDSLGYVTLKHNSFVPYKDSIKLKMIKAEINSSKYIANYR